jgi:Protein of unknown function (DUF3014)
MAGSEDPVSQNASTTRIAAGLVLLLALAGGGAWWYLHHTPEGDVPVTAPTDNVPPADPKPVDPPPVQHPLEQSPTAAGEPLPPVGESDGVLADALKALIGAPAVQTWLVPDEVARRFVATIDNLPRNVPLEKRRPLRSPPDAMLVDRTVVDASAGTESIVMSARSAARYDAAVALFSKVDPQTLVASYRRFYPLLQQAYQDLGYPDRYFNDRLVEAIDDMLRAPEPAGPVRLVQPKVLYQYEDPSLERLSAGQKLLLRMGPAHERAVKDKLRALRALIATAPKQP